MPQSPHAELPALLPLFPLTGALLLPGNWLPLHIFEPRYRHMVEDAMGAERYIGMVQPVVPRQDNSPQPGAADGSPELYQVGCAGRIEECEQIPDGRFLVALVGVSRFRLREELPLHREYRRGRVDYGEFQGDLDQRAGSEHSAGVVEALAEFAAGHNLSFDLDRLRRLPSYTLVNGLAMALPFTPAEKQALLEADQENRREVLLTLLNMGLDLEIGEDGLNLPQLN